MSDFDWKPPLNLAVRLLEFDHEEIFREIHDLQVKTKLMEERQKTK
jgi:hypothetical protein